MIDDKMTLWANGKIIEGWTTIRVSQGIEIFPNQFELSLTEVFPGHLEALRVNPGDYCEFKCGKDIMVAGYIDRYFSTMSGSDHSIRLSGRGKCQDLLDCSAEWPNGQLSRVTAKTLAEGLAQAYGGPDHSIKVICDVPDLYVVPQLNLMLGESAYEVIDRVTRYSALLMYENPQGDLVLARAGTTQMASGFLEGVNVEQATIEFSADGRFSNYTAYIQSIRFALDAGEGGNLIADEPDTGVLRHRGRHIIAEATQDFEELAKRRARWERNRRNGRSEVIKLVTDSWRDGAGNLWAPNSLVSVYLPTLKMVRQENWLISEVTFTKDAEGGTQAALTIMAPAAFDVEPMSLNQSNLIDYSGHTL